MSYQERLRRYEADKRRLAAKALTAREHEAELKRLRDKWKI